nr:hypothetical protein [Pandoravirus belohorizontensis]
MKGGCASARASQREIFTVFFFLFPYSFFFRVLVAGDGRPRCRRRTGFFSRVRAFFLPVCHVASKRPCCFFAHIFLFARAPVLFFLSIGSAPRLENRSRQWR